MKNTKNTVIVIVMGMLLFLGLVYILKNNSKTNEAISPIIGGERNEFGCLIAAGYDYSEDVGACIRAFELTSDIMRAAKIAVNYIGKGYALTLVSFNSYEEVGAYDFVFERGIERKKQAVYIKNWQVQK